MGFQGKKIKSASYSLMGSCRRKKPIIGDRDYWIIWIGFVSDSNDHNGNPGGDLLEETDSWILSGLLDYAYLKDRLDDPKH